MKIRILIILLFSSFIFSQYDQDARMLGLSGAYTNIAEGFSCIGINPANLSYSPRFSMNIVSINASVWNNALSLNVINGLNNADMVDTTSMNYYDKSRLEDLFDQRGLVLNTEFNLPFPMLNLSYKNWALTSTNHIFTEVGMPSLLIDFLFLGNSIGERIDFELPLSIQSVQETGISYSRKIKKVHVGVTGKHLLGYYYTDIDMVDSAFFMTDTSAFEGKGGFLLKQGIGGSGFGMDIGVLTEPFQNGWQVGMSITNLFGDIEWKQDGYFRQLLEGSVQGALSEDMKLRSSEYYYYFFGMDSVNAVSLSSSAFEDLFYSDGYAVVKVGSLTDVEGLTYDATQVVELSDSSGYLVPSIDITDKQMEIFSKKPFTTRYPSMFRFGVSKRYNKDLIIAMDLNTGFSSDLGSYNRWRMNLGTEITRFKHFPIRFGIGLGGERGASLSMGTGIWYGKFHFDMGLAYKRGLTINSTKGFDFGFSFSIN
tara:strand:+ start:2744 stop:4189 length:1446 start_codon:yes stop_codon:yes gene_type:complete